MRVRSQIRRSSAGDHVVANCSNLVFYSALYRQPVQIHALERCTQDEHHSSSDAELCLRDFEEYQPTGNYSNLNGTGQEM